MNIDISNAHCGPRILFPDHSWLRVVSISKTARFSRLRETTARPSSVAWRRLRLEKTSERVGCFRRARVSPTRDTRTRHLEKRKLRIPSSTYDDGFRDCARAHIVCVCSTINKRAIHDRRVRESLRYTRRDDDVARFNCRTRQRRTQEILCVKVAHLKFHFIDLRAGETTR